MCQHIENYKTHLELSVRIAEQLTRPNQNYLINSFNMVNVYSNQVKYAVSRSVHGAKKKQLVH